MSDIAADGFTAADLLAVQHSLRQPPGTVQLPGTVVSFDALTTPPTVSVRLADGATVAAKSRLSSATVLAADDRVMVEFAKPHGVLVVALLS